MCCVIGCQQRRAQQSKKIICASSSVVWACNGNLCKKTRGVNTSGYLLPLPLEHCSQRKRTPRAWWPFDMKLNYCLYQSAVGWLSRCGNDYKWTNLVFFFRFELLSTQIHKTYRGTRVPLWVQLIILAQMMASKISVLLESSVRWTDKLELSGFVCLINV